MENNLKFIKTFPNKIKKINIKQIEEHTAPPILSPNKNQGLFGNKVDWIYLANFNTSNTILLKSGMYTCNPSDLPWPSKSIPITMNPYFANLIAVYLWRIFSI